MRGRDFTLEMYTSLLNEVKRGGYQFFNFEAFLRSEVLPPKSVILRHDVDRAPVNALRMAILEYSHGVSSSYYFRVGKQCLNDRVIKEIAEMSHEIGYHYEDLCLSGGDPELAIRNFEANLGRLRKLYPVKTICMHGSPLSKWDNRLLWRQFDYRNFGIIGECYHDSDFNEISYLTDTGRKWNASAENVRDSFETTEAGGQRSAIEGRKAGGRELQFRKTTDIIEAVKRGLFPIGR